MSYNYGMMMPPMLGDQDEPRSGVRRRNGTVDGTRFAFKGKGKGKGKRSPQLNVALTLVKRQWFIERRPVSLRIRPKSFGLETFRKKQNGRICKHWLTRRKYVLSYVIYVVFLSVRRIGEPEPCKATEAGKSRWVEIFRGKGKGTGAVVWGGSIRGLRTLCHKAPLNFRVKVIGTLLHS